MHKDNTHIVLTVDTGGTCMAFSALRQGLEIAGPVQLATDTENHNTLLDTLVSGFTELIRECPEKPSAISMAFPGPCDYRLGITGILPNFPGFPKGFPLASFLEERFKLPVFINNDGNLFTLGEWKEGYLPYINAELEKAGNSKRYSNLLGLTFGTGFGAGVVINGILLTGDNSSGGDIWCTSDTVQPGYCAEAGVGRNSLVKLYRDLSTTEIESEIEPRDIYDIACGIRTGDMHAAIEAFAIMGKVAGNAIANALSIVDGLVVIGGGLSGAYGFFIESLMKELNGTLQHCDGRPVPRLEYMVYNTEDRDTFKNFCRGETKIIGTKGTGAYLEYDAEPRTGIGLSRLGTSRAVALGAYIYAIDCL